MRIDYYSFCSAGYFCPFCAADHSCPHCLANSCSFCSAVLSCHFPWFSLLLSGPFIFYVRLFLSFPLSRPFLSFLLSSPCLPFFFSSPALSFLCSRPIFPFSSPSLAALSFQLTHPVLSVHCRFLFSRDTTALHPHPDCGSSGCPW